MKTVFSFRRLMFETASALHAGSGESDPTQDMPIQLDVNGLPSINATSITGVLRHLYPVASEVESLFGSSGDKDGSGSCLLVSDALVLDERQRVVDGLLASEPSEYLVRISQLMRRDHCALDQSGSARKGGKFDRTVLMAGVRFLVELTVLGTDTAVARRQADTLVKLFASPWMRLGGGTRDGFGRIQLLKVTGGEYDLAVSEQREAYLRRPASLAEPTGEPELALPQERPQGMETLHYRLSPEKFWLVSDGTGLYDLDIRPKREARVVWKDGKPDFPMQVLLPATSVKGALAHRTAYHHNILTERFADRLSKEEREQPNPAVRSLFGYAKGDADAKEGRVGRVMLSDLYLESPEPQTFNHVMIDRFTGGALEGALFTEQVIAGGDFEFEVTILPSEDDLQHPEYRQAFDLALKDLVEGRLPLGGGTMRGLGNMKGGLQA
ncbi:MAG: hypothetical protein IJJ33_02705 [Victivallales bacterium]|nr:hypothetical protein [Victivallales bacterium]